MLCRKGTERIVACGGYHWKKIDPQFGTLSLEEKTVRGFAFAVTCAIASVLPVAAIWWLLKVDIFEDRMSAVFAANMLTSIVLGTFIKVSRAGVFEVLFT